MAETPPDTVLDAALWVAREIGGNVFPVDHPDLPQCAGAHGPSSPCDGKRGKHPCVRYSLDATTTVRDIIATFAGVTRNYGVETRRSRLLIIDEDTATLADYAARIGETVPETFEVGTGRPDGKHLWFRLPSNVERGNSRGKLPAGIDVRAGSTGFVVGPGSRHANGNTYTATWDRRPAPAPQWLIDALAPEPRDDDQDDDGTDEIPPAAQKLIDADADGVNRSERFHAIVGACRAGGMNKAATIAAVTPWCARVGKYEGREPEEVDRSWQKVDPPGASSGSKTATSATGGRPELNVGNAAIMAEWLREHLGTGPLAGMFLRRDQIVHTPRESEDGYVPLSERDTDSDGPAQVRPAGADYIAAQVQYTYSCYRNIINKNGEPALDDSGKPRKVPALFPVPASRTAVNAINMMTGLRKLRGVVHAPVFREDGTLIEAPGYDVATGLLHLPEPGLTIPSVPDRPTQGEVKAAVALLGEMIAGFPFINEHHRANYLGMLVTPLLRTLAKPPYKLAAIEAHQPGSGKTLLANLARLIHGGVFRSEVPDEDAELRKQITAILSITTGPLVVLDNATGALRSSTLAGLLTSDQWDDRPLGSTSWARCINDRLWVVTGNNLNIGGDLPRRTLRTVIDPGQPQPELRTGFAIADLEGWVKARRGDLLRALLILVRAWVVAGRPMPPERSSDGYARWVGTVSGILANAGIPGTFDHPSTQLVAGTEDNDWRDFLRAIHGVFGDQSWTVKELLSKVETSTYIREWASVEQRPLPIDVLPAELADRLARANSGPMVIAKSLGRWLLNRTGRWAGPFTVRQAGETRDGKRWRIETEADRSASPPRDFAGMETLNPTLTHEASEGSNDRIPAQGMAERNPPNPQTRTGPPGARPPGVANGRAPAGAGCAHCGWPHGSIGHQSNCNGVAA